MFKRAELAMKNPPGQTVNPVGQTHETLTDYIKHKQQQYNKDVKKMTFDEWADRVGFSRDTESRGIAKVAWDAGRENM